MMQHCDLRIRSNLLQQERQIKQIFTAVICRKFDCRAASADGLLRTEQRLPFRPFDVNFDERAVSSLHDMVDGFHGDNSRPLIVRDLVSNRHERGISSALARK